MPYSFRSFQPGDLDLAQSIQQHYVQANPGVAVTPLELYLSPYFEGGQNVRAVQDSVGKLVAYAPFFPQGEVAWVEMRVEAGHEGVKSFLFDWLVDRARAGGQHWLNFQYLPVEASSAAYAESQGARRAYGIYNMLRSLKDPLPDCYQPEGYTVRRWRLETLPEQESYLAARNACFPEALTRLDEWQFFTSSPLWAQGSNMAAFAGPPSPDGSNLAASVLVYWEPGSSAGMTEYVFTLPDHRGRGLARALLVEGMHYLHEHGLQVAALEVKADNEGALSIYRNLGYEVVRESRVYQFEVK